MVFRGGHLNVFLSRKDIVQLLLDAGQVRADIKIKDSPDGAILLPQGEVGAADRFACEIQLSRRQHDGVGDVGIGERCPSDGNRAVEDDGFSDDQGHALRLFRLQRRREGLSPDPQRRKPDHTHNEHRNGGRHPWSCLPHAGRPPLHFGCVNLTLLRLLPLITSTLTSCRSSGSFGTLATCRRLITFFGE